MSKTLTLAATGLAGLVLGAGIGVAAAAGQDTTPTRPDRTEAVTSMDEMHGTMADHMGDDDHAGMMASMGSMMDGPMMDGPMMDGMDAKTGKMPTDHDAHHPEPAD